MTGVLSSVLLRAVPDHLLANVAIGRYQVYGSIVRSVASGRIVGHLQETSGFVSLLSSGSLAVPQAVFGAINVVQNEQIKNAVAVVQSLQVANLALSGLSVGVSIAGTAILARRIASVEKMVGSILPELAAVRREIEGLRSDRIGEDFTRLRTLADQIEEAWLPSATHGDWMTIARDAHFLADSFERRAREVGEANQAIAAEPFIDAFLLASGLRVTARLALGQDDMARNAATARTHTLIELGAPLRLGRLALEKISERRDAASPEWQEHLEQVASELSPIVAASRERELSVAASAETLQELARQEISGREWLEASSADHINPLLFLPVSEIEPDR